MTVEGELLWEPSPERAAGTRIAAFARHVGVEGDYDALWRWSVGALDGVGRARVEWAGGRGGKGEAFPFGTRLTRVTRELRGYDPDRALRSAARAVPDWAGGT